MAIDLSQFDDSFYGGATNDVVNGLDGDDTLAGNDGNDTLNGGNDNDYLYGYNGRDKLNGGSGEDHIYGGVGDTINGGDDVDYLQVDLSSLSALNIVMDFTAGAVNALSGNTSATNIEVLGLYTGNGNDSLTLDDSAVYGAASNSGFWYGGNGIDTLTVDWSGQTLAMYGGTSSWGIASSNYYGGNIERFNYTGGSGNDNLNGGALADVLVGNAGNDSLTGGLGADDLDAGDGDDYIYAGYNYNSSGNDNVFGGADNDTIYAAGGDTIDGGGGRDVLYLDLADKALDGVLDFIPGTSMSLLGVSFNNVEQIYLQTGSGNDSLTIHTGYGLGSYLSPDGTWNAGAGTDTIHVDFSAVIFNISASAFQISYGDVGLNFSNVEAYEYIGGSGFDSLTGADVTDTLTGNDGNDTLNGVGGADVLDGGAQRDNIYGGTGDDDIDGGSGRDGLRGDDGDDTIAGGSGNDSMYGGAANDTMNGAAGLDYMQGDGGADSLNGGADADLYVYNGVVESTSTDFDTVTGFDFDSADHFRFNSISVTGLDVTVGNGTLSDATFDTDMETKINATKLLANHAVFWNPSGGDHAGDTFLIVDVNGVAGYQTNQDYVIAIAGAVNFGSADLSDLQG